MLMSSEVSDFIIIFMFFLLIISTANDDGLVSKILCSRVLVHFGVISYSIYMIHFVVMRFFFQYKWFLFDYWVLKGIIDKQSLAAVVAISIIATVLVLSEFTYRFVEVPARSWLKK